MLQKIAKLTLWFDFLTAPEKKREKLNRSERSLKLPCIFCAYVIDYLDQFGWHCEADHTVRLPPSHLRKGINGLGLEKSNRVGVAYE